MAAAARSGSEDVRKKTAHAMRASLVLYARNNDVVGASTVTSEIRKLDFDDLLTRGALSKDGGRWKGFAVKLSDDLGKIAMQHDAVRSQYTQTRVSRRYDVCREDNPRATHGPGMWTHEATPLSPILRWCKYCSCEETPKPVS